MVKRLFDIVFASCVLLITSPLFLLGALVVNLTSPGPAFYKAKRAGLEGKEFYMFKLRTMHVNTDTLNRKITDPEDDRITPVGKWLRKLKIDEFPQFWNVLKGDMSIVGPRPEDYDIVQNYYTPEQRHILKVRPGITSPVEVRWYPDLTYHDRPPEGVSMQKHYLEKHLPVQLNEGLRYVEQQNIFLDLKIIIQTFYCILIHSWFPAKKQPLS
ncbi:sugar transferase [Mastigocoleus testarum]|uniref:Bacterial sugar transferase domain-containing protein n=1 Tax=Mastigocoleus testarum BC008 TaxID=371196 RepID=A0A0V7ZGL8_9CYAN|nr:sugar transferase [Mastigocoleus testarum]KST63640.1 hypothetical protein BC008_14360 [Mastigocoleus testarum BC008]